MAYGRVDIEEVITVIKAERDVLREWDDYFRKQCGYKRDGRNSPECLQEYLDKIFNRIKELEDKVESLETAYEKVLSGIKSHSDTARKNMRQSIEEGDNRAAQVWSAIVSHIDIEYDSISFEFKKIK